MKNIIQTAAIVSLMALGSAAANAQVQSAEAGFVASNIGTQSTVSRQQVINEAAAAIKDDTYGLSAGDYYMPVRSTERSTLTRAEVRAETLASMHDSNRLQGESSVQ